MDQEVFRCEFCNDEFNENSLDGSKRALEKHLEERTQCHFQLLRAQIVKLNQKLSELEKDVTLTNGYLWKIKDWDQKTKDSAWLISPEFYTHPHGYKIEAWLYPDKTQLTVLMGILPGEFDEQLDWPFSYKVTFTILNQTGGVEFTRTVDPTIPNMEEYYSEKCFKRPIRSCNNSFGFRKFISHEQFNDAEFIKDNCLYMRFRYNI